MDLEAFRKRVRELCRPTGYSQKMLARELGLQPTALSNKLNGTGETSLKQTEVRQIIKILAQWEALTFKSEVIELLEMMNLRESSFTPEEWNTAPLNKLAAESALPLTRVANPSEQSALPSSVSARHSLLLASPAELTGSPKQIFHNLPASPAALIGRKQEIAETLSLLHRADVRLVTLTGSGGVGKTRLALELATELLDDFEHGVFFVSLAPISDPGLVLATIARTLDIRESGSLSVAELLKNYLRDKHLLLVLDNFEQVLAAAGVVRELMAELPGLKLLITSRALLRIYGEYEYVVPPLALPDPALLQSGGGLPAVEQLASYEAIALFVQRARATNHAFKLTHENVLAVAQICRQLDGLPLALELAAARIKILTPQLILDRLGHRLELLNRGPQDLPERQQTLRALIDWSYDLLEPAERKLLARLAVFAGGGALAAVDAICWDEAEQGPDMVEQATLRLNKLTDLADKSMLQLTPDLTGELRFSILETLREYGLEKLKAEGEEQTLRERHALYFLKLAEQADLAKSSSQQKTWLDRLETEHDNFRVALGWAIVQAQLLTQAKATNHNVTRVEALNSSYPTPPEGCSAYHFSELALRMSSLLAWFWDSHGHLSEGRRWLAQALGSLESQRLEECNSYLITRERQVRAKALNAAGNLARKQDDNLQAATFLQEALALRRQLGQLPEIGLTLNNLGALAYHQGDYAEALKLYEESLAIKLKLGDKRSIALSLNNLAELHHAQGNEEKVIDLFEESLKLLQEVGDRHNTALVLLNLGVATGDQGDYRRARVLLTQSLEILGELGDKFHLAEILERLAGLIGEPEQAARLFGAAASLRVGIGAPMSENYRERYEQSLQTAKSQIDPLIWANYWTAGQHMNLEEALDYALVKLSVQSKLEEQTPKLTPAVASTTSSSGLTPKTSFDNASGLTQREVEVLKLVAGGLTTAKIAEKLILSPLTVQAHLRSIYSKLEISSRSAATRYALENKLV